MSQRERIEAMCCGDRESADLVESLLRRERLPYGTDGESASLAPLSSELVCRRCGWSLDSDLFCALCGEISIRPVVSGGRSSATPGTEEPT